MRLLNMFLVVAVLISILACNPTDNKVTDNATVGAFYLRNDSIEGIEDIKYTIDEDKKLIYNIDSAGFGVRVNSAFPYIAGVSTLSQILIDDSIQYSIKDTLFIDFSKEVKIKTVAADEETFKEYTVKTIVHQVNPDTFMWEGANSQIYTEAALQEKAYLFKDSLYLFVRTSGAVNCYISNNASEWEPQVTTLPKEANIDRIVVGEDAMYYTDGAKLYISEDAIEWTESAEAGLKHLLFSMRGKIYAQKGEMPGAKLVSRDESGTTWEDVCLLPVEFPQTGMAVCVAEAPNKNPRVFVFGGRDSSGNLLKSLWSSDNGTYWADLTIGMTPFTPREGVGMTQYADGLMIFGGVDADGLVKDRQLFSADHGITWSVADSIALAPDLCVTRNAPTLLANSLGYIYIIGGRGADGTYIKNAWRGLRYASLPGFKK